MNELHMSDIASEREKLTASSESTETADSELNLSAQEWLVVFPAPTPNPDTFLEAPPSDPAKQAREVDPLNREALLREVDKYPLLGTLLRMSLNFASVTRHIHLIIILHFVGLTACNPIGYVWAYQDGYSSARQMVAGLCAVFVAIFGDSILSLMLAALRVSAATTWSSKYTSQDSNSVFDRHAFAGLARWSQLVEADAKAKANGKRASLLLRHVEGDAACPCPAPECSGRLVRKIGPLMAVGSVVKYFLGLGTTVTGLYTLMVFFGARSWHTWYSALLMCFESKSSGDTSKANDAADGSSLAVITVFIFNTVLRINEINSATPRLLELALRVQRRALMLAVSADISRLERAVNSDWDGLLAENMSSLSRPPTFRLYSVVHDRLVVSWAVSTERVEGMSGLGAVVLTAALISAAINPIAAGCIPAAILVYIAFAIAYLGGALWTAAAANAQVSALAEVYRDARRDLRELALRAGSASPVLPEIHAHEALLSSYTEIESRGVKLLGFVIGYGTLRGIVVICFTVATGLWGIFRSTGTYVTIQCLCMG